MPGRSSKRKQRAKADAWGIDDRYEDALGGWHETPAQSRERLLEAMGATPGQEAPPSDDAVMIVRTGKEHTLPGSFELTLEDGEEIGIVQKLPPDLLPGYHQLSDPETGREKRLIAAPPHCYLPAHLRIWGWSAQLYAARSRDSWGIGDFRDLYTLANWSRQDLGAGFILINPIAAATPAGAQEPSPYSPSSRRFRNILYICVEDIPGAQGSNLEPLAIAARDLNQMREIRRDEVFRLKMKALESLWNRNVLEDQDFAEYRQEEGSALENFAAFCALSEKHGPGWQGWPAEFRRPDSDAVRRFARQNEERIAFHQWLQYLLDRQMQRVAGTIRLVQDLPVGVDAGGADAWAWQDLLALDADIGAPPDEFNTQGQNWGLPPFIPHKLKAAAYQPFIETIRAGMRNTGGLRIDHVMGLFRLFWVPKGSSPADGAYVRYPAGDLLAIVALESHRAGAFVVGEDLGTVEEGVRERLLGERILSYRLLWFEKDHPRKYPAHALTAVTTHDLPTIAGLWKGSDLEEQNRLNLKPNAESTQEICRRVPKMAGFRPDAGIDEVVLRTHELLAQAPSMALSATLDDVLGVEERPNIPNTTSERPNWSVALPVPLEELMERPLARDIARALSAPPPARRKGKKAAEAVRG